ncbi:hypothetical protein Tco_1263132 [Tanacetum coccineum]
MSTGTVHVGTGSVNKSGYDGNGDGNVNGKEGLESLSNVLKNLAANKDGVANVNVTSSTDVDSVMAGHDNLHDENVGQTPTNLLLIQIKVLLVTSSNVYLIIEQRVKVNQKTRILDLKQKKMIKTIVLTTYTPYPSRKIRRIRDFTQHPQREDLYVVSRRKSYAVFKYKSWNIMEYNNRGAHAKKPQYAVLNSFNTAYRLNSRPYTY